MQTDEMETVLRVACLTEDRSPDEQRAMLAMALRLDSIYASFASVRRGRPDQPMFPALVRLVENTYCPDTDQKVVLLTAPQREQLERLEAKFSTCDQCGVVRGLHALVCLREDVERYTGQVVPTQGRLA